MKIFFGSSPLSRNAAGPEPPIDDGGFTLVELVLSMTLLAIMVGILYGSFFLSERAVAKAQARADHSQNLRTREEILAGYIRSAFPYRLSARDASVYFIGSDRAVEFISSLSTGLGGRGMSRVRISSDLASGGADVSLEEEMPVRVGDKSTGGGGYRNNILLAEGLRGLRFEYLDPGTDTQKFEENWVDEWDGKQKRALPRAIRLVFRGDRGEEVRWTFPVMIRVLAP
ncbi:MAG TPA: prepilin-type N-terminal cleavage/methylation domain-containing protein [Verrucomicrobiae bacterium]|jgi:prepilin-type N-terminal cleavage/methylation domain-containing protein|nr:prepilin-type N-terminal cleavage/methylation domain-containing protein [Verrucomicrobiae bacterium]